MAVGADGATAGLAQAARILAGMLRAGGERGSSHAALMVEQLADELIEDADSRGTVTHDR
jgi:hypothetical protein